MSSKWPITGPGSIFVPTDPPGPGGDPPGYPIDPEDPPGETPPVLNHTPVVTTYCVPNNNNQCCDGGVMCVTYSDGVEISVDITCPGGGSCHFTPDPPPGSHPGGGVTTESGSAGSSVNGMGTSNGRRDELLRAGDVAGPSATTSTPIMAASGFKVEDVTDLEVELPGQNFKLIRNFAGNSMFVQSSSFGLMVLGGWMLSTDTMIGASLVTPQPPCATPTGDSFAQMGMPILVQSPVRNCIAFQNLTQYKAESVWHSVPGDQGLPVPQTAASEARTFLPLGGGSTRLIATSCTGPDPEDLQYAASHQQKSLDVWKLVEPGAGTSVFFRITQADSPYLALNGKLWKQIDEYGHEWNFSYVRLPVGNPSLNRYEWRLWDVYLHGDSKGDPSTLAIVHLDWDDGRWAIPVPGGPPNHTGSGIWHLRCATLLRRSPMDGDHWTATDQVEYWYRGDVELALRAQSRFNVEPDHYTYLGTVNDLVQVVHRSAVGLPTATVGPRQLQTHTAVTQYRYTVVGGNNASVQIKGVFAPEQIEAFAREHWGVSGVTEVPEPLVTRGREVIEPSGGGTESWRWQPEAAAWGLLTLGDRDLLMRPEQGATPPVSLPLWRTTHKWVCCYGQPKFMPSLPDDPPPTSDVQTLGQVEDEYLMPGDGGHTLHQHYTYPDTPSNNSDRRNVKRVAKTTTGSEFAVSYQLKSSVTHIEESTRRSDASAADNELSASAWTPRRRTTHRSEDRELFTHSFEDAPASGGVGTQWVISCVPFTVAELVEDLQEEGSSPRSWLTIYDFDKQNRPQMTIDPGAVNGGVAIDRTRLSNWRVVRDTGVDRTRLGSISTVTYTDYLEPSPAFQNVLSLPIPPNEPDPVAVTAGREYAQNYPSTMRIAKRYAGFFPPAANPGLAQPRLLHGATYRDEVTSRGTFALGGGTPDPDTRPDLLLEEWEPVDGADTATAADPDNTKQVTTYAYTLADSGNSGAAFHAIRGVSVSRERERVSENGPGDGMVATTTTVLDPDGNVDRRIGADGVVEGFRYDDFTGKVTETHSGVALVNEVWEDTSDTLFSRTTYDIAGNTVATVSADGVVTSFDFTVDALPGEVPVGGEPFPAVCASSVPHSLDATTLAGPVVREWYSAQLGVLHAGSFIGASVTRDSATSVLTGMTLGGQEVSRTESDLLLSGLPVRTREWEFASADAAGVFPESAPTGVVYTSSSVYDGDGNPVRSVDAVGSVVETTYDARARVTEVRKGVAGGPALTLVEERFYDGETASRHGIGDGLLTLTTVHPGGADARGIANWYDARKRLVLSAPVAAANEQISPAGPYSYTAYDNLDRPVLRATLAQTAQIPADPSALTETTLVASTDAIGVQKTLYSQRGLAYRTLSLLERVTTGAGAWAVVDHWFDPCGRELAVTAANAPATKRQFDAHGRVATETRAVESPSPSFADATNADHGFALERSVRHYLDGKTLLSRTDSWARTHGTIPSQGPLPNGFGTDPTSRVITYATYGYDRAGRLVATIKHGTNTDGSVEGFTSASSPAPQPPADLAFPVQGDPSALAPGAMLAWTAYNSRGQAERTGVRVDGTESRVTRSYFDSLGRVFATVESYHEVSGHAADLAWSPSHGRWSVTAFAGDPDENRVSSKVFDGAGRVTMQVAHLRATGGERVEATGYRYQWLAPDSDPGPLQSPTPSNNVLYEISYPSTSAAGAGEPSSQAYDRVRMAYNALGEQIAIQDQNGTTRGFLRDHCGRAVVDRVLEFGTRTGPAAEQHTQTAAVDNAVTQLVTEYDAFGRTSAVLSFSNPSPTGSYSPANNPTPQEGATLAGNTLVRNAVTYSYTYAGAVERLGEYPDGGTGSTAMFREVRSEFQTVPVTHPFATGRAYQRATRLIYPDHTPTVATDDVAVNMEYTGPVDSVIGRVSGLSVTQPGEAFELVKYARLGLSTFAVTDLTSVGIQMDRSVHADGRRQYGGFTDVPGAYGGWDRFGRLVRNSWVSINYGATGTGAGGRVPLWQEKYGYDLASRKLRRENTLSVRAEPDQDWRFEYDRLDRVTVAERGRADSAGVLAVAGGSKSWSLDEVGNWNSETSYDATGPTGTEARAHNASNEIASIGGEGRWYDASGNTRQVGGQSGDPRNERYTYDAWNRLRKLERERAPSVWDTVTLEYNALHWKVKERRQLAPGGGAGGAARRSTRRAGCTTRRPGRSSKSGTPARPARAAGARSAGTWTGPSSGSSGVCGGPTTRCCARWRWPAWTARPATTSWRIPASAWWRTWTSTAGRSGSG